MGKVITVLAMIAILILVFAGQIDNRGEDNQSHLPVTNPGINENNIDPIQTKMENMSLEEKIGQLVLVGMEGYTNDEQAHHMIEEHYVGGFILFDRNIRDSQQMLSLLNSLKETNAGNQVPLFLSVDEEGGRVSRMPADFIKVPTMQKIGQANNSMLSYQLGQVLGEELQAAGFNMDFAPILDINSNPKNPVIGDRALGDNAEIVSRLGIQTMKGLQSKNVISVVKHFPGHGDTAVDSHVGLPVVNHDIERLKDFEFQPFLQAINNDADAIMIAHILLPQIDPENPASFSKAIITDILRTDMNFDGVVITDDMTMGAISNNYDIGEAAVESINAGSDIILVCHEFEKEEAVINALLQAAESGIIPLEKINQSVHRVLSLKEKYNLADNKIASIDPQTINKKIQALITGYSL